MSAADWYRRLSARHEWVGGCVSHSLLVALAEAYSRLDFLDLSLAIAKQDAERANQRASEIGGRLTRRFDVALAQANDQIEAQSTIIRALRATVEGNARNGVPVEAILIGAAMERLSRVS